MGIWLNGVDVLGASASGPSHTLTDFVKVGTGTPGVVDLSGGDGYITDDLEVDGTFTCSGLAVPLGASTFAGIANFNGGYRVGGATNDHSIVYGNTTYDQLTICVGADLGRQFVFANGAYFNNDYDHAAGTDPVVYIQSASDPDVDNTEYGALYHDQTDFNIDSGKGDINLGTSTNVNGTLDCTALDANTILLSQNSPIKLGGTDGLMRVWFNTSQTVDALQLTLDGTSNTILIAQEADRTTDFGHSAQTDPTLFMHSADATDTTQFMGFAHNQTDAVAIVGAGGQVTSMEAPVSLADDASFSLPDASVGYGFFTAITSGAIEAFAQISWTTAGAVTLISNSVGNVADSDTDGSFCFFDGGTSVTVRNRLGGAREIMFNYTYTT